MKRYQIQPGTHVDLDKWEPGEQSGTQANADARLAELRQKLEKLQEVLFAEHKHRLLVVLQAMDTGGKDGTIRRVFEGVNPQGVRVAAFKAPTTVELDHDYLWRVHPHIPGKGEITIFNRSHYEDVLIVRVHKLAPEPVWRARYDQIVDFERMLSAEGTTILKFFLHISKQEQQERLQDRLDDPDKHWKFNPADLIERKLWSDYMHAYADAIEKTSTEFAPWYIVPSNHKWYRNLVVATTLVETLEGLKMRYPESAKDLDKIVIT